MKLLRRMYYRLGWWVAVMFNRKRVSYRKVYRVDGMPRFVGVRVVSPCSNTSLPSAADLDAVAEEQRAKEKTGGHVENVPMRRGIRS